MTDATTTSLCSEDLLPPLSYRDLELGLNRIAESRHLALVPYLISALREQAPFLSGQMVLFEILRSANCLADEPLKRSYLD